jgi:hypothetical protein
MFSSTLKMEAIRSSETSVASQQTTRRYIPEDDTPHNHCCENLKSYIRYILIKYQDTFINASDNALKKTHISIYGRMNSEVQ